MRNNKRVMAETDQPLANSTTQMNFRQTILRLCVGSGGGGGGGGDKLLITYGGEGGVNRKGQTTLEIIFVIILFSV